MLLIENRWTPTVVSVLLASALWALRKREKVSWITIAGLPVLGICLTIFVTPGAYAPHRMAWLIAGWGALFVLEGAIALTRYLLQNPESQVAKS
jgi:drug/metabolite transporter (DMT)-like permease